MKNYTSYSIIVAGGSGTRIGGDIPKQFQLIGNLPMLAYSLLRFHEADADTQIILVLPEYYIPYWKDLVLKYTIIVPHQIVKGGKERFHSVKNALDSMEDKGDNAVISIHDAARPLVSKALILHSFSEARIKGSAIPVIDLPYSLRKKEKGKWISVNRNDYKIVQTPQVFNLRDLQMAYKQPYSSLFTDDASVFESAGFEVHLIEGENNNIKVTTEEDMEWVRTMISKTE